MGEGSQELPGRYTAADWAEREAERHREADRSERLASESRERGRKLRRRIYRMREFPKASSKSYSYYAAVSIERLERAVLTLEALADQHAARAEYLRAAVFPQ
jgi:hypothetical protein